MGWLDTDSWKRASHFEFFKRYEQPFFNVCTDVDVSGLYARSHQPGGPSFFLSTVHAAMRAANELEAFRLRLRDGRVWRHDVVHPGSTVLRADDTFTFAYLAWEPDLETFVQHASAVIARLRAGDDRLVSDDMRDDVIYFSVLPWIRFTSFAHARLAFDADCIPRIVFGKHFERDGHRWLPLSVDVHHALVDGLDVGHFVERFSSLVG